MLCGSGFFFKKPGYGELGNKSFLFSPFLNVFSFQYLQDQMSFRNSMEDKLL